MKSGRWRKWIVAMALAALVWTSVHLDRIPQTAEAHEVVEWSAEQIYEAVEQSVFYLRIYREDGTLKTVGSGFLLGKGTAVTAAHVVADAYTLEAVFDDGRKAGDVEVIAADPDTDAALLSIREDSRKPLSLSTGKVKHGQRTYAVGYPLKESKIITEGIVNAPTAPVNGEKRLLISAQVSGGMSGGPILGADGSVIGLISGSFRTMSGIHIGVTADDIRKLLQANKR